MFRWRERVRRINALKEHRAAFKKLEIKLFGETKRAFTHDLDKLVLYRLLFPIEWTRKRHKRKAKHHNPTTKADYLEKMVDCECARETKRNSPMTAREYVNSSVYSGDEKDKEILLSLLNEYNL